MNGYVNGEEHLHELFASHAFIVVQEHLLKKR